MFIFRSVVGKLWLTIIGLVGVVLLILGFFLVNYMENYFAQATDQTKNMKTMAAKFSEEASQHMYNEQFYELSNELLKLPRFSNASDFHRLEGNGYSIDTGE